MELIPAADGGVTRSTFILSQAFLATTGLQLGDLKGQNGTDTTRHKGANMSSDEELNLKNLMDHVVEGNFTSEELNELKEDLQDGGRISADTGLDLLEDVMSLRLAYTVEELIKTIVFHLLKPKDDNKRALRDYRKSLRLLAFVIARTKEFVSLEEEADEQPD